MRVSAAGGAWLGVASLAFCAWTALRSGGGGDSGHGVGWTVTGKDAPVPMAGRPIGDLFVAPRRRDIDADPTHRSIQALSSAASSFLTPRPDDMRLLDIIASMLEARRSELSNLDLDSRTTLSLSGRRSSSSIDVERCLSLRGERWTISFEPNTLPVSAGIRREHASIDALRLTLDLGTDGAASIPSVEVHFIPACRSDRVGETVVSGYALTEDADGRFARTPYESVVHEREDGAIGYESILSLDRSAPHPRPDARALAKAIRVSNEIPAGPSGRTFRTRPKR